MAITSLRIADFRNLVAVELLPVQHGMNVISGNNGSGKTSLLEAIHYLGMGKSFRSSTSSRLIRYTSDKFSVFSQLVIDNNRYLPVGVERDVCGMVRIRVAEQDAASITDIAAVMPIRVINSHSHNLFESGPVFRRKFIDWGLFYQMDGFLPCWRQYERVLKQRNAVLRDRRPKRELDVWTDELVKHGVELDRLRREYIQAITPIIVQNCHELLGMTNLDIRYQSGWSADKDYASALADAYHEENRLGHTQYGPHRADLDILSDGVSVKHFLSRGQQKLLICAMIIAQGICLAKYANKSLIYLVDDLPSELDLQSKMKLISLLSKQHTQIFITAIESDSICDFVSDKTDVPVKVFHVEHGSVVEMADTAQL